MKGLMEFNSYLEKRYVKSIRNYNEQLSRLRIERMKMRKKLKRSSSQVYKSFTLSCDEIITIIDSDKPLNLVMKAKMNSKSYTSVNEAISRLIEIQAELTEVQALLDKIVFTKYNQIIVRDILSHAFYEMSLSLLQGEKIVLPKIGSIKVVRSLPLEVVDWKTSNQLKQDLVDANKVPFKALRLADGTIIGNNGGVPWLVKKEVDGLWLTWGRSKKILEYGIFKLKTSKTLAFKLQDLKVNHKDKLYVFPHKKLINHA